MIYVITGPTGVGKTNLSIKLAKKLNASIINCDSMQIYKELNIGTAKIKEEEMQGIKHYLINTKSVFDDYNVCAYQKDARKILNELIKENKNVLIVGGTGLYLKALLYDYKFDEENITNDYSKYTLEELVNKIKSLGKDATYISSFDDIVKYVRERACPNDIILTVGAGTVTEIGRKILLK